MMVMAEPYFRIDSVVVAVFDGVCPPAGSTSHSDSLLWWHGDAALSPDVLEGKIAPTDRLIPLAGTQRAQRAWMLIHHLAPERDASTNGPVLVIEDNDINLAFYVEVLERDGYEVLGASTGQEAFDLVDSHNFSLVISDIRLPDANGFEISRSLSSRDSFGAPVVLMSADPTLADSARVVQAGAVGFIVNPIRPADLLGHVASALAQPQNQVAALRSVLAESGAIGEPRLKFFGDPRIEFGAREIRLPRGRSTEILATLAARCPQSVSSSDLVRFAWPADADVTTNAVYTAVSRLRTFLEDAGLPDLVTTEEVGYRVKLRPDQIDLAAFDLDARELRRKGREADAADFRKVLDVWSSRPFENTSNTLLSRWSIRLSETRARMLVALARHHAAQLEFVDCERTCDELLPTEPWRERIWAVRATALYRQGRTNDALAAVQTARTSLREELGLDPGPVLAKTELMVLSHDECLHDPEWIDSLFGESLP